MEHKKVLFLRFSSLGDIIFANYSAMRIKEKHPEFHLTWMTDSMYADIVRAQPWVDGVIEWDRKNTGNRGYYEILRKVRNAGFDILVDMHASDRSSIFSLLSGIKKRYATHKHFPLVHNRIGLEDLMDVSLDIGDCPVYLRVPTSEISNKISSEYRYKKLGLAIGASAAVKRWPARRWAEFCRFASGGEYRLYLIGSGTEEEALAEEIVAASAASPYIINMVGKTSIMDSVALAGKMDVIVSGDTGLMHVARALGVPVVGLFGPNFPGVDSKRYIGSLGAYFICKCPNVKCEKSDCSRQCLEDISATEVWNAVRELTSLK
mgnify:CR=1 FL=1